MPCTYDQLKQAGQKAFGGENVLVTPPGDSGITITNERTGDTISEVSNIISATVMGPPTSTRKGEFSLELKGKDLSANKDFSAAMEGKFKHTENGPGRTFATVVALLEGSTPGKLNIISREGVVASEQERARQLLSAYLTNTQLCR